jgi:hypothetical protein
LGLLALQLQDSTSILCTPPTLGNAPFGAATCSKEEFGFLFMPAIVGEAMFFLHVRFDSGFIDYSLLRTCVVLLQWREDTSLNVIRPQLSL